MGTLTYEKIVSQNLNDKNLQSKIVDQDSDGDGFKDWEEVLWKTDPHDPKSKPDPEKQKNTSLSDSPKPGFPNEVSKGLTDSTLTKTDLLGRKLFASYISLKQKGELTQEKQAEIVEQLVSEVGINNTTNQYEAKEIKVIKDSSPAAITQYWQDFNAVFLKYSHKELGTELEMLKNALAKEDQSLPSKLAKSEEAYQKIVGGLLQLSVPEKIAQKHLLLVNSLTSMAESVGLMAKVFSDPLSALIAIKPYQESAKILVENFKNQKI